MRFEFKLNLNSLSQFRQVTVDKIRKFIVGIAQIMSRLSQ